MATQRVDAELGFRRDAWRELHARGGPRDVAKQLIRDLKMYGGAQGVWVDAERTRGIAPDGGTVTVGLLHTGLSYPDDLSSSGILYHYPRTGRGRGRDASEIAATKRASEIALPVFVITPSVRSSDRRDVHLGWVVDYSDDEELFLVTFTDDTKTEPRDGDLAGFLLFDSNDDRRRRTVASRPNQERFRFEVLARYGSACAVCEVSAVEVLDTVHLADKAERGADDAQNGLVLCATHHRALDRGLFAIHPGTLAIHVRPDQPGVRLRRSSISHLRALPHPTALDWRWRRWPHAPQG